ncbi:MAG: hypothetical protein K8J08_11140, partial [Thermoanaerobaculia bacterium]|nr:hypothetical protein [Thermoanaerobaculia bacterium]
MSNPFSKARKTPPRDSSVDRGQTRDPQRLAVIVSILIALALLVALGVLLPGLDNGLVSDDWVFVYRGMMAHDLGEFAAQVPSDWFSRPVFGLLAYGLARGFGSDPLPYHVAAVVVHLLNSILLTFFAWRLSNLLQDPGRPDSAQAYSATSTNSWDPRWIFSLAVGGLFFLYSRHHEVLYWFSAISESLAFFFRLLALVLLTGLLGARPRATRAPASFPLAALAGGLLAAAALASKESAVILPAELLLVVVTVTWRRRTVTITTAGSALGSAFGLLTGAAMVTASWGVWYLESGLTRTELTLFELGPVAWILRLGHAGWNAICLGRAPHSLRLVVLLLIGWLGVLGVAIWRRHGSVVFATLWLALCLLPYVAITSVFD